MFLGTRRIDDLLTFTVTTHTFATGALTDADSVPAYRVYEAETGTAIVTGSMAKLDDANTTGHYSEEITLSAANGFENGKSYNIYITAAVSSVTGGAVRHFYIEAAPATAAALTTVSGLVDDLEGRLTATRAGYLDNLSAGAVALEATAQDIPTNAELATALGTADDATLAAIAALNNLSSAGAQAAAAAALLAYNAATEGDVTGLSIPTAAAVADAVWDEALAGHVAAGSTGEALDDASAGGGGGSSAADIWSYASRTLTAATVAGPGTQVDGGDITALRGDSFSVSLTGLGNISARTRLWFTAKRRSSQTDAQAEIQIVEATGLAVIAGGSPTAGNGSLTVTNATTGAVTLALAAAETAKLPAGDMMAWDIQMLTASGVLTLAVGTLKFSADVTRATA